MKKFVWFVLMFLVTGAAHASVVTLKNGDRVSGEVLEDTENAVKIKTELLGEITINKDLIAKTLTAEEVLAEEAAIKKTQEDAIAAAKNEVIAAQAAAAPVPEVPAVKEEPAPKPVKYWDHKMGAGYSMTNGNTKTSAANITLNSHYKRDSNEWNIKSSLDYASSKGVMTVQKFYSKAQSDTRLGGSKWYNSRSVELSHDKFATVDYRVLPAVGMGYWFWEGDDSKAEFDTALGYEYTNYNKTDVKASGNFALIPHLYFDKVLVGKAKFAQDLTFYPSLDSFADYRMRSESSIVNPLSDVLSWKVSYIDEYNSSPKGSSKKNDSTFMSSIEYAF